MSNQQIDLELCAVIAAVTDEAPRVLTVQLSGSDIFMESGEKKRAQKRANSDTAFPALPFGAFDADQDRTLELGLRRWVTSQTGVELGYVEQLYTFGNKARDPRELLGGPRLISIAYLALARESQLSTEMSAGWHNIYEFFPWEDWRSSKPPIIATELMPRLQAWQDSVDTGDERQKRKSRIEIAFPERVTSWDGERVLERYELLYEAGIVGESLRDQFILQYGKLNEQEKLSHTDKDSHARGVIMSFDHRRILASALGRLRGKIRYRPVVFEMLPDKFTLLKLQRIVEALSGVKLHKQNFRRLVEQGGLVENTKQIETETGGRPAKLFRFRREVLSERPAPGVGLPKSSAGSRGRRNV